MSAAAARYVWRGSIDERTVACVLAGLATKGHISIQRERGKFKVNKLNPPPSSPALAREEQRTMEWLFSNFLDSTIFDPNSSAQGCIASLGGVFDSTFCREYQSTRAGYVALGIIGSLIVALALASLTGREKGGAMVLTFALYSTTLLAGFTLWFTFIRAAADLARGIGSVGRVLMGAALSALPVAGLVGLFPQLARITSTQFAVCICALAAINIFAIPLLRSATPKGIEARQQIEGFREYLIKVEQDRLNRMIKPNTHPAPSATWLGYAIALEVKEAWGDDLANACYPG